MRRIVLAVIINAVALWVAQRYVPGFQIHDGLATYLAAGLVLGLLNMVVKPVLKVIAFPLMLVTLGLFSLAINALLLWLLAGIVPAVVIAGLMPLAGATLIVTAGNIILGRIT